MMNSRPIKRSKLRLAAGKAYYTMKRRWEWMFGGTVFAKHYASADLKHGVADHRTPLLRKLRDVDMWYQYNKIHNLRLAVARLNGLLLRPGETFSYWRTIGKPTRRKGYVDGMVLFYGNFKPGVGGGLCQLSNLIYWMTLHTPLDVVERHRHSYDVFPDSNRKLPFGSGATCSYNYMDLQIRNNTNAAYQLKLQVTDDELVGEWRSTEPSLYRYEVYESDHRITAEPWGGYMRHNRIYRTIRNRDGEEIANELVTENHALMMYAPLLQTGEDDHS